MSRDARPCYHARRERWYARIGEPGPDGKSRQVYAPPSVKTEAQAWKWLRDQTAGERVTPAPATVTVRTLMESYLSWAEAEVGARRMAAATYAGKVVHLSKFQAYAPPTRAALGTRAVADLDVADLESFLGALAEAEYSAHYIHDILASVQAALNWGARPVANREPTRLLPAGNPLAGYRTTIVIEGTDRYVDAPLLRRFFRWAWADARRQSPVRSRFGRIFVLLLRFLHETGCRPAEACAARWSGIDRESGTLTVPEWKNKRKTGRDRVIHLTARPARIVRALERLADHHPEFVFTHLRGRGSRPGNPLHGDPWDDTRALGHRLRQLRARAIQAGVAIEATGPNRMVAYLLRHTYGADAKMAGLSDHDAAELMGTSADVFNTTYGRVQRAHSARKAEELARRRGSRGQA